MPTAFVTGGTGFLGANLVDQLLDTGWEVTAFHRASSDTALLDPRAIRVIADLDDVESLKAAMPEGVDAVFHVAGDTSFWKPKNARQTKTNVDGTRHVCQAALARGAGRLVHTSSVSAWGELSGVMVETRDSTAATGWVNYDKSKWLAEQEVHAAIARGLDATIVNPCNIVGPKDRTSWGTLFPLIRDGKIPGLGPGTASWCHVRDVAAAHIAAFHKGRTGQAYLLGGPTASFVEVGVIVADLVGGKAPPALPAWALKAFGAVSGWVGGLTGNEPDVTPETARLVCAQWSCDSSKARAELDYGESSLEQMFRDCHAWLTANRA